MFSFPDASTVDAPPAGGTQVARAVLAGLQNEIPPERIARRIREMLEATFIGPDGVEIPDWRTIEAGMRLYLAFVSPAGAGAGAGAETGPPPGAQAGSAVATGAAVHGIVRKDARLGGAASRHEPAAGKEGPLRELERLEFMRKMMVLDSDAVTSRRDAEGRPVPRQTDGVALAAASGALKRAGTPKNSPPPVRDAGVFRKVSRLAVAALLAGGIGIVWMAGNTVRDPVSGPALGAQQQQQQQQHPSHPKPAAVAAQPRRDAGAFKDWFFEDIEAEKNPPPL